VINDRKKKPPDWDNWKNTKVKYNKRAIINISENRIDLWRVVGRKYYRDSGQEPGPHMLNIVFPLEIYTFQENIWTISN
jgi:hypothetical protein